MQVKAMLEQGKQYPKPSYSGPQKQISVIYTSCAAVFKYINSKNDVQICFTVYTIFIHTATLSFGTEKLQKYILLQEA
jgi:hypothetical protein